MKRNLFKQAAIIEPKEYVLADDLRDIIHKYNPNYLILDSGRDDGKSYAAKKFLVEEFWNNGVTFTYLRRTEVDLKRESPVLYWDDFGPEIQSITGGEWTTVTADSKFFYLARPSEEDPEKLEKGPAIANIHALSIARSYKSMQYPTAGYVLFEEYCTDSGYLYNETNRLMNYVSTIFRDRQGVVIMLGNKVSKINPYFRDWQLINAGKMQPGQVDVYRHHTTLDGSELVTNVVMYSPTTTRKTGKKKRKSMFFGTAAGMIEGQEYDSMDQPKLSDDVKRYRALYTVVFAPDPNACFLMTLLEHYEHPDRVLWYVEPKTSPIKPNTRVVGGPMIEGDYWTRDFTGLTPIEKEAFRLLQLGRVAFSDNLTGTEFYRALAGISSKTRGTE